MLIELKNLKVSDARLSHLTNMKVISERTKQDVMTSSHKEYDSASLILSNESHHEESNFFDV
jgi:hypothetical protein